MSHPAVLPGTETHVIHSQAVGVDFRIYIQRPMVEGPLPVLYVTDANWFFGTAVSITNMLLKGGEIPPVITVGIGYPNDDEMFITTRRMYDFSPTTDQWQLNHGSNRVFTQPWKVMTDDFSDLTHIKIRGHGNLNGSVCFFGLEIKRIDIY